MTIVLLLVGLGLIVLGADWLVDGASGIARKTGVSEFVIGLTSLIVPVAMTDANRRRDIPLTLFVTVLLLVFGMSRSLFGIGVADSLARWEGGQEAQRGDYSDDCWSCGPCGRRRVVRPVCNEPRQTDRSKR